MRQLGERGIINFLVAANVVRLAQAPGLDLGQMPGRQVHAAVLNALADDHVDGR